METACQLCPGTPLGFITTSAWMTGTNQLTSLTSVVPPSSVFMCSSSPMSMGSSGSGRAPRALYFLAQAISSSVYGVGIRGFQFFRTVSARVL